MASNKTCGKCQFYLKVNWNDYPRSIAFGRNGICKKYDYNIKSDGTYAQRCHGYKPKKYKQSIS